MASVNACLLKVAAGIEAEIDIDVAPSASGRVAARLNYWQERCYDLQEQIASAIAGLHSVASGNDLPT